MPRTTRANPDRGDARGHSAGDSRGDSPSASAPAAPQADSLGARLFRQAQQGDRGAFGQFCRLYQDRLYNAMLRMVGNPDDALELTQDALTRALSRLDSYRGEAGPYTWLFRIAMNLAISHLRSRRPMSAVDDGDGRLAAATEAPDEAIEREERQRQVLAALGRLDADHRIVLVMRDVEGFDYQQMAAVLELPLNTLKSRLFRARMALRDELAGYMK
ncbi:MAG: sigma-70 family RNA polymerase sigma factor [Phycisphaerae bacterium]|nr:sigma-70 family RNA polymerase sigma factor [Phycisphaerae bacterium]